MAKPAHTRVTFEGVIGTVAAPLERWSFNVNFPQDVSMLDSTQALDDAVAAACRQAYVDTLAAHMPTDVLLTQIKVSQVLATGHVAKRSDDSYAQGVWVGTVAGTLTPQTMPLSVALCVSLNTARSGATGKGRFFLPWPGYPILNSDKRLTALNAQTVADAAGDFLDALSTPFVNAPQVVSSKGYMSEVISVRVGRVPDTMRSRRDDQPEGYVSSPLA